MGISIFSILVMVFALFIAATTIIALTHFNKLRKLHMATYVADMTPNKARTVRVSCGVFLIMNALMVATWIINGVARLS